MKNNITILLTTFCFLTKLLAQGQSQINIDVPDEIRFGEEFVVKYTINQKAELLEFKEPSENFSVVKKPTKSSSQSTTIKNGEVVRNYSTTFSSYFMAKKTGIRFLPKATITANGKQYSPEAKAIQVLKKSSSTGKITQPDKSESFAKISFNKIKAKDFNLQSKKYQEIFSAAIILDIKKK